MRARPFLLAVLAIVSTVLPVAASAAPTVASGYTIEAYASGVGAVSGLTLGPDGLLYAADHNGRILRIDGNGTVTVIASGVPYLNGITFTSSGRLFTAAGGSQAIFEVAGGVISPFAAMGASTFPTSVTARGDVLYVSNSGNGTISRVLLDGSVQQILGGFSVPRGPMGISFDDVGVMHFIDHATGRVHAWDLVSSPTLLYSVSPLGGTFTAQGFGGRLFVTDTEAGTLLRIDSAGVAGVFASGFIGKSGAPFIGPNGIAYDGEVMFVDDGDTIYRISPVAPTVEQRLAALLETVNGVGPGKSLAGKVLHVQERYSIPDIRSACRGLSAFSNEVRAQAGKKIALALAQDLLAEAEGIQSAMGCY